LPDPAGSPTHRVDLAGGARNAVAVCLGVTSADRFVLVGDEATSEVDDALEHAALETGARCLRIRLDRFVRPLASLHPSLREEILEFEPTVSTIAVQVVPGELPFISALRLFLVDDARCRHAQMAGITRQMMEEGMAADYHEVAGIARRLHEIVGDASEIAVTGEFGTDLVARFTPAHRWVGGNAIYREPGQWGNLPAGEVATSPLSVEGVIATKVLGDQFGRYGMLAKPARFVIRDTRAVEVDAPSPAGLEEELLAYLDQHPCSRRVGEFAIGCNTALTRLIGHLLQDEKFPGVHVAFGDPYARETGADWSCPTHVDVVASGCTLIVDGTCIMRDGAFLV
jgi:leucyl aminopeptidase (aminopeptidase T)